MHEVELFNPHSEPATLRVDWLPRGQDNTVPPDSEEVVVAAQTAVRFDDLLLDLFGLQDAVGSVRLVPLSGSVEVDSWVLNVSSGGAYGQSVPTVAASQAFVPGEQGLILHLREDDAVRSNVWCQNMTAQGMTVDLDLYSDGGFFLSRVTRALQPLSTDSVNRIFIDFAPVLGYVVISTSTPGGAFTCTGTALDNITSDPRTEPTIRVGDLPSPVYVPYAVHSLTASTDIDLFASAGNALARIGLLRTGEDNVAQYDFVDIVIPEATEARIEDVLGTVLPHSGTAALEITALTGEAAVSAQVVAATPSGTRLRHSTVRPGSSSALPGDRVALIHLTESAERRTDLGVVNTSTNTIDVVIELGEAGGELLGVSHLAVLPLGHEQVDGVFAHAGFDDVPDGIVRLRTATPGGSFLATATVTDLATGDSFEVAAVPLPPLPFADGFESGDTTAWSTTVG